MAKYIPKGEAGSFVSIFQCVIKSKAYTSLSSHAVKLLYDLLAQYNGNNNGDLSAPFSTMKRDRNWRSKGTLNRAIKELLEVELIEVSRQGGRHKCSLYAVTFYAVDECKGKLDIKATLTPKSSWRKKDPLPDIKQLQQRKQEKDDAILMKRIIDRQKLVVSN